MVTHVTYTVEPPKIHVGQIGTSHFVLFREVVLSLEVENVENALVGKMNIWDRKKRLL